MTDRRKATEISLRVALEVRQVAPAIPWRFVWFGGDDKFWPIAHEMQNDGARRTQLGARGSVCARDHLDVSRVAPTVAQWLVTGMAA